MANNTLSEMEEGVRQISPFIECEEGDIACAFNFNEYLDVSGDAVVWTTSREVKVFNPELNTVNVIDENNILGSFRAKVSISDNLIVWTSQHLDENAALARLCDFDFAAGECKEELILGGSNPVVSGNRVVWEYYDGNEASFKLAYCDYNDGQCFPNFVEGEEGFSDSSPSISGDYIVFRRYSPISNSLKLMIHDIKTEETVQFAEQIHRDVSPKISGNTIVWTSEESPSNVETSLYFCKYESETQKCLPQLIVEDQRILNGSVDVSKNRIVWDQKVEGQNFNRIKIYDIEKKEIVEFESTMLDLRNPAVSADKLSWIGIADSEAFPHVFMKKVSLPFEFGEVMDQEVEVNKMLSFTVHVDLEENIKPDFSGSILPNEAIFRPLGDVTGDVTGDGQLLASDSLMILKHATDPTFIIEDKVKLEFADVNRDGEVTKADALLALELAVSAQQTYLFVWTPTENDVGAPHSVILNEANSQNSNSFMITVLPKVEEGLPFEAAEMGDVTVSSSGFLGSNINFSYEYSLGSNAQFYEVLIGTSHFNDSPNAHQDSEGIIKRTLTPAEQSDGQGSVTVNSVDFSTLHVRLGTQNNNGEWAFHHYEWDLPEQEQIPLRGQIFDVTLNDRVGVAGVEVVVEDVAMGKAIGTYVTDANGRYETDYLRLDREYRIHAGEVAHHMYYGGNGVNPDIIGPFRLQIEYAHESFDFNVYRVEESRIERPYIRKINLTADGARWDGEGYFSYRIIERRSRVVGEWNDIALERSVSMAEIQSAVAELNVESARPAFFIEVRAMHDKDEPSNTRARRKSLKRYL